MTVPRPLDGMTVVDMTAYVAGPMCTQLLADMGAEVIKVERPPGGDVYRRQGPEFIDGASISFLALNKGKKSVVIDVKSAEGRKVMDRLLAIADVFVHNFRPGTASRLGVAVDDVARLNPRTVWATVSGYGGMGPKGDLGGYDLMLQGESGLMEATGHPDRPPAKAGFAVIDLNAAVSLAFGIVTSLLGRERTGQAQTVESSLYETSISMGAILAERFLATGVEPRRNGSASPLFSPYQAYRTSDGYLTVEGTGPPGAWQRFCDAIGIPEFADDPDYATNGDRVANQQALQEAVEARTALHPTDYWIERMQERSLPCGPIRTIGAALGSVQTEALGMVVEAEHPNGGTFRTVRSPLRLGGTALAPQSGAPRLGEHTSSVLSSIGFTAIEIQALESAGVIVTRESDEVAG